MDKDYQMNWQYDLPSKTISVFSKVSGNSYCIHDEKLRWQKDGYTLEIVGDRGLPSFTFDNIHDAVICGELYEENYLKERESDNE